MGVDEFDVVADHGCFKGEEVLARDQDNITENLPRPLTSGSARKGLFNERDFIYHVEYDEYECPAGDQLIWRFAREEQGQLTHKYWSSSCPLQIVERLLIARPGDGGIITSPSFPIITLRKAYPGFERYIGRCPDCRWRS